MKKLIQLLPIAAIVMLLAACNKKSQEAIHTPATDPSQITEIVQKVNATRNNVDQVTCRMSMDIQAGTQKLSVGGNLKMKRNDVIQLSLQVFGFVEAGRLELTPDYMLILNRIGKQYVKVAYKDVPYFKENGINFYTFQALMWNELFVSGQDPKVLPTAIDFAQAKEGNDVILTNTTKRLVVKFVANAASGILQQTRVLPINTTTGGLLWKYQSWARLGKKDFPDKMEIGVNINTTNINATLQLTRLRSDEKWTDTRTNLDKKKLKQVSLESAFNQIMSLSN